MTRPLRLLAFLLGFVALVTLQPARGTSSGAGVQTWLVVSDLHYDPFAGGPPSDYGSDTNTALLDRALAGMRQAAPNPAVVMIAGDFLAHHFEELYHHNTGDRSGAHFDAFVEQTFADLARRFDRTFPHAQFVIAFGNNDDPCGDYRSAPGTPFFATIARAWAPLVDRNGAAPEFVRDFSRYGAYTARLPVRGLRAVVADDVVWSPFYRNACATGDPAADELRWLTAALRATPRGERNLLVLHVPIGIDAYASQLLHDFIIIPFLRDPRGEQVFGLVNDPANRVALVVAGHAHKFSYRLSDAGRPDDVPVLLAPAISPVYRNNPAFLTLQVDASGAVRDVTEYAFTYDTWTQANDFARDYGLRTVDAVTLSGLQRRLATDTALRDLFAQAYVADAPRREIDASDWRLYWCAMQAMTVPLYRQCLTAPAVTSLRLAPQHRP